MYVDKLGGYVAVGFFDRKLAIGGLSRPKFSEKSNNIKMLIALIWMKVFGFSNSPKRPSVFTKSKK